MNFEKNWAEWFRFFLLPKKKALMTELRIFSYGKKKEKENEPA